MNLEQRILKHFETIKPDVMSLKYVGATDFFNFFPKSEQDQIELEKEADEVATVITQSVRGHYRKFNAPIKTEFGEISIFKIRPFDASKVCWLGSPDFVVSEWDEFVKIYKDDKRFFYFKNDTHPTCQGYTFESETSRFCFCNPPVSDTYK